MITLFFVSFVLFALAYYLWLKWQAEKKASLSYGIGYFGFYPIVIAGLFVLFVALTYSSYGWDIEKFYNNGTGITMNITNNSTITYFNSSDVVVREYFALTMIDRELINLFVLPLPVLMFAFVVYMFHYFITNWLNGKKKDQPRSM